MQEDLAKIYEQYVGAFGQETEHRCEEMEMAVRHSSVLYVGRTRMFGPSIFKIEKVRGNAWVAHNGEYATFVKFCPFCGEKLA